MASRAEKLAALKAARAAKGKQIDDAEDARLKLAEKIAERREERESAFVNSARAAGMDVGGFGGDITAFLTSGISAEEMIKQRTAKRAEAAAERAPPPAPPK